MSDTIIAEETLTFYSTIPIAALNSSTRRLLAKHLNIPKQIPTDEGYLPDYTGISEIVGFDYADQQNFGLKPEPTVSLLDEWQKKPDATIGRLCHILIQLNRLDVLSEVKRLLDRDANLWSDKRKKWQECSTPVQDDTVSQTEEAHVDPYRYMVSEDIGADAPCQFDAFVCSSSEDLEFVKELIRKLESPEHGLKLCIPERDLLPGGSDSYITGNLIEKRCKRMIAVMSPSYLQSPQCDFQTKFAHALSPGSRSKKVVPILLQQCTIPSVLRHITYCDYTRTEVHEWFWGRLAKAIMAPLHKNEVQVDSHHLGALRFDLDTSSLSSFSSGSTDTTSFSSSC